MIGICTLPLALSLAWSPGFLRITYFYLRFFYGCFGFANGFAMTLGIPFLYGVTRAEPYKDRESMLGLMVVAMLLADLCGFLTMCGLGYTASQIVFIFSVAIGKLKRKP